MPYRYSDALLMRMRDYVDARLNVCRTVTPKGIILYMYIHCTCRKKIDYAITDYDSEHLLKLELT